ncbi:MAG TPA: hypothetical protein VF681_04815 [Abditibacteriaceae bacterium]
MKQLRLSNWHNWVALVAGIAVGGCSPDNSPPDSKEDTASAPSNSGITQDTSKSSKPVVQEPATQTSASATFDIPSLIGKSIDEITNVLGQATGDDIKGRFWKSDEQGHGLLVDYQRETGKVYSFRLDSPEGATSQTDSLLALGNLTPNANEYRVFFTTIPGKPGFYSAVEVRRTYEITYRLSGAGNVSDVRYFGSEDAVYLHNQSLPWSKTVTMVDGEELDLYARVWDGELKAEILQDGRVCASVTRVGSRSASSPGSLISCVWTAGKEKTAADRAVDEMMKTSGDDYKRRLREGEFNPSSGVPSNP